MRPVPSDPLYCLNRMCRWLCRHSPASLLLALAFTPTTLRGDDPDLSQLSDEQKRKGTGQFQSSEDDDKERKKREEERRRRAEERCREDRWRSTLPYAAGAGGGAVLLSGFDRFDNPYTRPYADADFAPPSTAAAGDGSALPGAAPEAAESTSNTDSSSESSPVDQPWPLASEHTRLVHRPGFFERYAWHIDGQGLVMADISNASAPITQGIQSSQLRWHDARGFEASVALVPRSGADVGWSLGGLYVEGSRSARVATANRLFTRPSIGFAGNAVEVERHSQWLGLESNWIMDSESGAHAGLRVHRYDDALQSHVLPQGVLHRIETESTSCLFQLGLRPSWGWERLRLESSGQIGIGAAYSQAHTRLSGVVGPIPQYDLAADGFRLAACFNGRLGAAFSFWKHGTVRTGVQLFSHSSLASASRQIADTDFSSSSSRLKTSALSMAGLYAGLEFAR